MAGSWHLGCSFTGEIVKESAMCTKWTRTSLLIAMLAAAPVAWADGNQKGGADPATKTLPATAMCTTRAQAIGQQAAQSEAAHESRGQNQKGGADPATKT